MPQHSTHFVRFQHCLFHFKRWHVTRSLFLSKIDWNIFFSFFARRGKGGRGRCWQWQLFGALIYSWQFEQKTICWVHCHNVIFTQCDIIHSASLSEKMLLPICKLRNLWKCRKFRFEGNVKKVLGKETKENWTHSQSCVCKNAFIQVKQIFT